MTSQGSTAFRKTPPLMTDCHSILGGLLAPMKMTVMRVHPTLDNLKTTLGAGGLPESVGISLLEVLSKCLLSEKKSRVQSLGAVKVTMKAASGGSTESSGLSEGPDDDKQQASCQGHASLTSSW